ncbi:ATP-binding protein [Streptomyces niger]|uniref:ATP-binding protein n=1 Tax=Streptomyces niger TaxID=66373 RepID=UPI00069A30C0|nr:ATP-binding protein [Streptomyces niger]
MADNTPPGEPAVISFRLPRSHRTVPRARAALLAATGTWGVSQEAAADAELLLSELVTNALRVPAPPDRQVGVRIVHAPDAGTLRLEVSDAGAGRPEVRTPGPDETGGRGLLLVAAVAEQWGVTARLGGIGKTVWAELKAPALLTGPREQVVAAALAQAGSRVRAWGEWHSVRSVGHGRDARGRPVVVLELSGDGPNLTLPATEPLTVRSHEERG